MLYLLTHDTRARRTLLTPILDTDTAAVEAGNEATLTLGPFSYRLTCLLRANVSQFGAEYDAQAAELYVQADFIMLTNNQPGALTLYRFHESTLQVGGCVSMSEDDLADLRRGGVFVRLYEGGADDGSLPRIALTFPLGTRVQEVAATRQAGAFVQAEPAFAARTPGPAGCEVHYTNARAPLARVWLPGPDAWVFTREGAEDEAPHCGRGLCQGHLST